MCILVQSLGIVIHYFSQDGIADVPLDDCHHP